MSDEIREHLMEYEESNSLDVEYEIPAKVLPSSLPSFNLVEEVGKISKHLQKLEQKLEEQLSISSSSPLSEGGASFLGGGVSQKNFEAFLGDLFHFDEKIAQCLMYFETSSSSSPPAPQSLVLEILKTLQEEFRLILQRYWLPVEKKEEERS